MHPLFKLYDFLMFSVENGCIGKEWVKYSFNHYMFSNKSCPWLTFPFSKSTIETLEKGVKYTQN